MIKTNGSYVLNCLISAGKYSDHNLAIGISGLAGLLILTLVLMFEVFFIYRYTITFLQRLYFYQTITATLTEVVFSMYLGLDSGEEFCRMLNQISALTMLPILLVEVLVIGFINLTVLCIVYNVHFVRPSIDIEEDMHFCCSYKKGRDYVFWVVVFVAIPFAFIFEFSFIRYYDPLPWINILGMKQYILASVFLLISTVINLIQTVISSMVLVASFCVLRRTSLSQNKKRQLFREMSLVIGFPPTFLALLFSLIAASNTEGGIDVAFNIFIPISKGIVPVIFLMYIYSGTRKMRKIKTKVRSNFPNSIQQATVPASTRISLPSATADHAPNFLSPSTAEPTDVTPLLKK